MLCSCAVEISNVRAFRYGLNTETVFSHSEVNSEAFKDVNNLSFYLIYDHGRAQETGDRSIEQSLNLTATSSQSYDLWSNLCGLIALWRLCKTPQVYLSTELLLLQRASLLLLYMFKVHTFYVECNLQGCIKVCFNECSSEVFVNDQGLSS